jgi:hypothetical protein
MGSRMTDPLPGVLGNWDIPPLPVSQVVSFGAPAPDVEQAPTWRINLPADPAQAIQQLDYVEIQLQASQEALGSVPDRIEQLVNRSQAEARGEVSFAAEPLPPAETELLRLLGAAGQTAVRGEQPEVSFGLGQDLGAELRKATEGFQQFTQKISHLIAHFAWVETQVTGHLLARTVVGWTGDMDTLWEEYLRPEQIDLHRRSLDLAITSRAAVLRTFIVTTQGAAKLSVLLATPGGAILALPAAWKYVNQILAELEKIRDLKTQ